MNEERENSKEIQQFFDRVKARYGVVSERYKLMASEDLEFTTKIFDLSNLMESREIPGGLSLKTKHLIWMAVESALKMEPEYIKSHIEKALQAGATSLQILEALEVTVLPTGFPSFIHGFNVWKEVVRRTQEH